jgi:ABC-type phosphate transport system substrate-binding protein
VYRVRNSAIQLTIIAICLTVWSTGHAEQVAVIAHKSVPLDTISATQLLDLYTRDQQFWDDGQVVTVFDLKIKGEVRDYFYRFLGKKPSRMKSIWMKKMLLGEGSPPSTLATEEELLAEVAATTGAIGFIRLTKVTDAVKTLVVIDENEK